MSTHRDRMSDAIRVWISVLEREPGWREWKRKHIGHTIFFDDDFDAADRNLDEFTFRLSLDKQRALVIQYFGLSQTIHALKECEFTFGGIHFGDFP